MSLSAKLCSHTACLDSYYCVSCSLKANLMWLLYSFRYRRWVSENVQHFRAIGSLFFVLPGNMDQCSWRCKVHAHPAVCLRIIQLQIQVNVTAVVTYLTSQAFKCCMTASLYFGSFLVLSQTVFCSVCIWCCNLNESNDSGMCTMIDNPFIRPTLLPYDLTVEKNYAVNISCKYWEKLTGFSCGPRKFYWGWELCFQLGCPQTPLRVPLKYSKVPLGPSFHGHSFLWGLVVRVLL
jgi:hypothetical protein